MHPKALAKERFFAPSWLVGAVVSLSALACGSSSESEPEPGFRSRQELLDPKTCKECHANHYQEWLGSMHAYSAKDPVFRAMNRRGQEETHGALGTFCVNCHAPMAVREAEREGKAVDWSNLEDVPEHQQGVTCYFCHNTSEVTGTHDNALKLSDDVTMRGQFSNAAKNSAHKSEASPYLTGTDAKSADACGACHDIVLPETISPVEVKLERTYSEWLSSIFTPEKAAKPSSMSTCAGCHMRAYQPEQLIAEGPGLKVRPRQRHAHRFAAVDVAFQSHPSSSDPAENAELAQQQRKEIQYLLDTTVRIEICVDQNPLGPFAVNVTLDNTNAGHNWPTGAAQDRRAWVEVNAYKEGNLIYSNAVAGDAEPPEDQKDAWLLRDRIFDGDREVHMFWEARRVEEGTITVPVTTDRLDPLFYSAAHASRRFPRLAGESMPALPDRVTVRIRLRAMGNGVLDDLVATGHLDPALKSEIPTFDLLPNSGLASQPGLESLASVSMEFSEATKATTPTLFNGFRDTSDGKNRYCVSMLRSQ